MPLRPRSVTWLLIPPGRQGSDRSRAPACAAHPGRPITDTFAYRSRSAEGIPWPGVYIAAHDHKVGPRCLLELANRGGAVAAQGRRVRPSESRFGAVRCVIFRGVVERVLEGAALAVPRSEQIFVRASTEEERPILPIRLPISATLSSSLPGIAQPPCANPSRVSSSGRPGLCITPSSVMHFRALLRPGASRSPTVARPRRRGPQNRRRRHPRR